MVKDAFEDYKRVQSDSVENRTIANVFNPSTGDFEDREWQKIQPGNIVKVTQDRPMPCDILLLNTGLPKGVCYVETKNLDGETNLKIKTAHKDVYPHFKDDVNAKFQGLDGQIVCEKPNNAIYKYEGTLNFKFHGGYMSDKVALNVENLLLRGSSLKNTPYVYGVCVFSGHDTKVMQNSAPAKRKYSRLEIYMNKAMVSIVCLQLTLAMIMAFFGTSWIVNFSSNKWESESCQDLPNQPDCHNAFYVSNINSG